MIIPSRPKNEEARLQELRSLAILDTDDEVLFDDLVKLGSYVTGCPIALVSLIDSERQWFKARHGIDAKETPRDISFCGHAIHHDETFVVEDALEDERFADNPLVTGGPKIRFYAGRPLVTKNGFRIGTLCTIDRSPKKLSKLEMDLLDGLARQASFLIEQRRNERTLEMTRRNSQTLFEKSPLLIVSMHGPNHVLEYVNAPHAALLNESNAVGKTLLEVQPQAEKIGFLKVLDDVYQTGKTWCLNDSEFRVDDALVYLNFVLTPRFGLDAKVDGVMGIIDDITERKVLELSLQKINSERELKLKKMIALLEQVPVSIALLEGPDLRFVFANRLYRTCFLMEPLFESKRVIDLFPEAQRQGFIDILKKVFQTGEAYSGRETFYEQTFADGQKREFFLNFLYEATTNSQGIVTGVLMAIADVTEQVLSRSEISLKVDELKSEQEIRERFVATLSHDLQNPLTAAKVGAERLKRKNHDTATVHKLSDRIIANIARTERMVRNLLDANRIQAGQGLPITPNPCCLNEIIHEAASGLAAISGRDLNVEERSGKITGSYDADGIRRVIENLASNAIKYGYPGTPIVLASSKGPNFVELSVHNQGPVIPRSEQAGLFNTYSRLDAAITGNQQGWGIGLALVKGIAQAHQGSVRVESHENKGTTFYVKLPLGKIEVS